ncbi:hypothetical protein KMS_R18150 [Pseudomonas sp. LRP2-20]|uniref:hypothetical protein n=1 Tax=Pseudomonas sp. LRP2-20 TaxID=2944234 RepID=UPI002185AD6F|nr:hypothetical protein [Pseudomonas sp. LRP2-20]BDM22057.1 hypothetical protein KMS_R18150 [Pseudomonas sp. LRP2-20]
MDLIITLVGGGFAGWFIGLPLVHLPDVVNAWAGPIAGKPVSHKGTTRLRVVYNLRDTV